MDAETRERLVDEFLQGGCASFALGAWEALGRPADAGIEVLFDDDGEPNTEDGRCAVHAFWSDSRIQADARGPRTPGEMADEYGIASHSVDGPYHPEEFMETFCGEDGPFEISDEDVGTASAMIQDDPSLLGGAT